MDDPGVKFNKKTRLMRFYEVARKLFLENFMFDGAIGAEITIVFKDEKEEAAVWGILLHYDKEFLKIKDKASKTFFIVPISNILYVKYS